MFKQIMCLITLIIAVNSYVAPKNPEVSLPSKLIDQTVSLVGYSERSRNWGTYCAGVWIDAKTILTAYHCAAGAKVMSLPEDEKDAADMLGQKLDAIGAPIYYGVKDSFTGVLDSEPVALMKARVVDGDAEHDLAIIEVIDLPRPHRKTMVAEFEPAVGDEVEVMGHPGGIEYTYAHGYVSGYRSDINQDVLDIHGPFMQINVGISGGNSGGGVFNAKGQLIGIVSFTNGRIQSQGFAVPVGSIKRLLEQYRKKKK